VPVHHAPAPRDRAYDESGWVFPRDGTSTRRYESNFLDFMSFFWGWEEKFPKGTKFTKEELLEITLIAVRDWLAMTAFSKLAYGDRDRSDGSCWSTLEYMKKAVSYFMPYKRVAWCKGRGNPTRSSAVNDLLHHVKQLEARNEGAPSRVKRPLMEAEFLLEMKLMRQHGKEKRD